MRSREHTTLTLVRHAQVDHEERLCGCFDVRLNLQGRRQLDCLREKLVLEPPPAAAYTSTLLRARETAIVAEDLFGIYPTPVEQFREISCGTVDGWLLSEVCHAYPGLLERNLQQNDDTFRWPGGESYREFRCRILRGVRSIAARHRGGRVLIFTHAGVISQIIGTLHRSNPARWEAFRPGYASITELVWRTPEPELTRFDDRRHGADEPCGCPPATVHSGDLLPL